MSKVRVYEVARQLGMPNRELVALFQSLGFSEVRNHMSAVEAEVVERIKRKLERQKAPEVVEERIRPTVVKRRSRAVDTPVRKAPARSVEAAPAPVAKKDPAPRRVVPLAQPAVQAAPAAAPSAPAVEPAEPAAAAPPPTEQKATPAKAASPVASSPAVAAEPPAAPAAKPSNSAPAPVPPTPEAKASDPSAAPEAPAPKPAPAAAASSAEPTSAQPPPAAVAKAPAPPTPAAVEPPPAAAAPPQPVARPKSGIEVWEGRPGVPMPQRPRTTPGPRRTTYDPRANVPSRRPGYGYGNRTMPGRPMRPGFRRGPGGWNRPGQRRGPVEVSTKEMSAHKMVVKIEGETSLQNLAGKMSLKATDVLMRLLSIGMSGVNINSTLDVDTAKLLAGEFRLERRGHLSRRRELPRGGYGARG